MQLANTDGNINDIFVLSLKNGIILLISLIYKLIYFYTKIKNPEEFH